MTIPKHNEIRVEALKLLAKVDVLPLREFEAPLAKSFSLTPVEIEEKYDSGKGRIFPDRISWALSYLYLVNLVSKPSRGRFQITKTGRELLQTPDKIEDYVLQELKVRKKLNNDSVKTPIIENKLEELTPLEKINIAFNTIKTDVYQEIIDIILSKKPKEFEKLVVKLLQKMGYGGEVKDSGIVTKQSGDGGIDGIIKEDVLGFGRIYIQAKRYARDNKVGIVEMTNFVGALAAVQSAKGVFITTSSFNKNVIDYVNRLGSSTTLILIDGAQLAQYMYDFSLGMQTKQTIEIKEVDGDFWDEMDDEISLEAITL